MAHILLVDDDEDLRQMLAVALAGMGHRVTEAQDGKQAITLFSQNPTDVVVTDLVMPDKDGLELVRELKRQHNQVKIIAMSGGGRIDAGDFLKIAKLLGADRILKKPFFLPQLAATLDELLPKAS